MAELFVKCYLFQLVLVSLSDMGRALGGLLYRVPLFYRGGPWGLAGGVTCPLMLLLGIPLINAPHWETMVQGARGPYNAPVLVCPLSWVHLNHHEFA